MMSPRPLIFGIKCCIHLPLGVDILYKRNYRIEECVQSRLIIFVILEQGSRGIVSVVRQKSLYPVRKPRSSAAGMVVVSFSANTGFNAPCELSR